MRLNGGDIIAMTLKNQGISHVFTLCGGHISPILVGCKKQGLTIIDVRHEVNAVFAADAMARLTGRPGVAVVTAGPGVTNTITAVKNALMAQVPLILLGGAAATVIKGRGSLQDIDQLSLFKTVTKMAVSLKRSCDIIPVLEKAMTIALSGVPGPVFIECPIDLLYDPELVRKWYGKASTPGNKGDLKSRLLSWYLNRHVDAMFACDFSDMHPHDLPARVLPVPERKILRAYKAVKKTRRPVMIIGSQAMLHPSGVSRLAAAVESMGIPVFLTGSARGLLGTDSAVQVHHHRREALQQADTVILAGMPCDFRLDYGRSINRKARLISVNRSRQDLYLNRRPNLAVHSDPFLFILGLAAQFTSHIMNHQAWLDELKRKDTIREKEIVSLSGKKTEGINPLFLLRRLEEFLSDDSIIVADGGDFVASAAYILNPRNPLSWLDPGVFGTLGVGAGFAMGARCVHPEKEIWIIYGDGAAGYSLQEFDTFVRHGLPVIGLIGNDAAWSQIVRDQVEYLHDDVATSLRHSDYHLVAEGFGAKGYLLDRKEKIDSVFSSARKMAHRGTPVLINAITGTTDFRKGSVSM
ncbi:MAG: acetolactate synthase [Spirochaetae bacterium HGW-Spirochaetae-1]|jgi:acetolactate synthase-1/2/3 large subunit|nr:MAG: acetolactate synthase [Spirochaetae bacterium HGW-Spirochaetae-1]